MCCGYADADTFFHRSRKASPSQNLHPAAQKMDCRLARQHQICLTSKLGLRLFTRFVTITTLTSAVQRFQLLRFACSTEGYIRSRLLPATSLRPVAPEVREQKTGNLSIPC